MCLNFRSRSIATSEDAALTMRVHLQEIDTGWQQDETQHHAWHAAVRDTVAMALALSPSAIVAKARAKRRGREQHAKTGAAGSEFVIGESGLRFLVNLEAYLDTGLFPDHRALRALVRERAADRRMLNLFAYTGSFTVYAAAGGAVASETVDLSNTYLEWAVRNFALNGIDPRQHTLIRADVPSLARHCARRGAPATTSSCSIRPRSRTRRRWTTSSTSSAITRYW